MISILIIKNGNCMTEIDRIIKELNSNIQVDIIHSSIVNNTISHNIINFYSGVIILGGHQSLTTRHKINYEYQYLNKLIKYIKEWIDANIYILGICLGAQLIAEAYGSKTKSLGYNESGYEKKIILNIKHIVNDKFIRKNLYNRLKYVLSYHYDYISLDDNNSNIKVFATMVNKNGIKIPYIIKINNSYGLQFHPDITINVLETLSELFPVEQYLIDYAKQNIDIIRDTSKIILNNWLNLIIQ